MKVISSSSHKLFLFFLLLGLAACESGERLDSSTAQKPQTNLGNERGYEHEPVCEKVEQAAKAMSIFTPIANKSVAQLAPLIGNVRARNTISLNGQWRYIVDQLEIGDVSPLLRGGVGDNASYTNGELLEYAFTDKYKLDVPGDWNSQQQELFWYRGVVWYQREFDYQLPQGKRAFIYFGGGNFSKDIYLNGKLLAQHKGGFTPFNIEITDYLNSGENALVVKVNSISGADQVPTEHNDWLNYGGLTRDVMLVETERVFIRNYKLQLNPDSPERIKGWVDVDGLQSGESTTLGLRIPEADFDISLPVTSNGPAFIDASLTLQKWSPETPKMYRVYWTLGVQTLSEEIGFRTIERNGEDILLNGKPIFLRGISVHEESLLRHGRASNEEDAAALIKTLKELNANFVRLAHYPHNEYAVRAADRAGILVWAELPVYHSIQFDNPCTLDSSKQQYSELIARDQNRASVVLWSLGNETPNSEARNLFFKRMADHVRELDDTRLLTAALLGFDNMEEIGKYIGTLLAAKQSRVVDLLTDPEVPILTISDPLGEIVDVIGYNEYLGWYMSGFIADGMRKKGMDVTEAEVRDLMLTEMANMSITTEFNKPLIISEFGAGAKAGKRSDDIEVWSEDYQARVYRQQIKMLNNSPALRGMSPWILKDFRAPYRLNTREQDYWNRKGLISESGHKKLAFGVLSNYYAELK